MSTDSTISISLDPKQVIQSISDIQESVKQLSVKMEEALGKEAPKSVDKMEKAAENGTNRIQGFFRNLGTRVKEDLKTAFDIGSIAGGLKVGQLFNNGIKEVLDMERAFDRLNVRLQLTGKEFQAFKNNIGNSVSKTGSKLEDVFPGVEKVAAKGGLKNADQLAAVGGMLGQLKATTGESTDGVADAVIDILQKQQKKVTATSFKETLDALEGTRINGGFGTVGAAGGAVAHLSGMAQKLGLNTRQLGGLAGIAERSGPEGMGVLEKIMDAGGTVGGKAMMNAGLGNIFDKKGHLDYQALAKVDTKKFAGMGGEIVEKITGIQGTNGEDLRRFIDTLKANMGSLKAVAEGSDETARDFAASTDNLKSKIEMFKRGAETAGQQVGDSISTFLNHLIGGQVGKLGDDAKGVGGALGDHAGMLAGMGGLALGGALLAGGGARGLMGLAKGAVGGQIAKAEGVTPVYVTNASEIGGGGALGGAGVGALGKIGGGLAAAGIGMAIGEVLLKMFPSLGTKGGDHLYDAVYGNSAALQGESAQDKKNYDRFQAANNTAMTFDQYVQAIHQGNKKALDEAKANARVQLTNPSAIAPRGKGH